MRRPAQPACRRVPRANQNRGASARVVGGRSRWCKRTMFALPGHLISLPSFEPPMIKDDTDTMYNVSSPASASSSSSPVPAEKLLQEEHD